MYNRHEFIGNRIGGVFESQLPESVADNEPSAKDWIYYRWYVQLESGLLFRLNSDRIELFRELPETVAKPTIVHTKWVSGAEYFARMTMASEDVRQDCIRENPFVRDHQVLSAIDTEGLVVGQTITAVIRTTGEVSDLQIVLVLNERNHFAVYDREGGNLLQFDALGDRDLDTHQETWHDLFDGRPCDIFGRSLL